MQNEHSHVHGNQPVARAGVALDKAHIALILLHGRGGSPQDLLALAGEFELHDVALVAPHASGSTWYPNRFIAPIASNEPNFSSAIGVVDALIGEATSVLPIEKIFLLGFSQGACLALEYAARHPRRYGGVVALSGALIENGDAPREYAGDFERAPIFLGCSDVDAHIPIHRVQRSANILRGMGATVDERIYPGMGHTVNRDEIEAVQRMLRKDK